MTSYERYAVLRNAKGLKDSDVCKMTGIGSGTMSDWKKGRFNLKADKLILIADALGCSLDVLTGRNPHYINDESAEIAEYVFNNEDMRLLFDAARGSNPENVRIAAEMLMRMKQTNNDG